MTREQKLKEIEMEYNNFIKTEDGKKWLEDCKTQNNGQTGGCDDYIYDFHPELLI